jgi:ubiquitin-protein ligase
MHFLGGFFKARLDFPKDYPIKPPKMVENILFFYIINIFFCIEISVGNVASEY